MKILSSCPEFWCGSIVITNSAISALGKIYYHNHNFNTRGEIFFSFFLLITYQKEFKYFITGDKVTVFLIISKAKENPRGSLLISDRTCDLVIRLTANLQTLLLDVQIKTSTFVPPDPIHSRILKFKEWDLYLQCPSDRENKDYTENLL